MLLYCTQRGKGGHDEIKVDKIKMCVTIILIRILDYSARL